MLKVQKLRVYTFFSSSFSEKWCVRSREESDPRPISGLWLSTTNGGRSELRTTGLRRGRQVGLD